MNEKYILVERSPTVEEYQKLREAVEWGNVGPEATEIGLNNSLFSVCVIFKNEVIGCGRVIGDGGIYFYIQDIIVLPEFQGKGIGKRIMNAVMNYLKEHALPYAFIGLMAAKGVSKFYEKYGFAERPPDRPGMFKIWEK
ncbi:MAG: GNAT family N-acetyltransferase [Asgard group archaeon]